MVNEGKISWQEATAMVIIVILAEVFLTFPAFLVDQVQTAAWMTMLVATAMGLLTFLLVAFLMERFPGKSIVEAGEELVGPVLNILFCLIYLGFFLLTTAVILRQYAERILTVGIPELPISVVMACMLIGSVGACYFGLEAIARSTWLLVFFICFTLLLTNFLTFPYWKLDYLFPLGGPGWGKIIEEGVIRNSIMGESFLLAVIAPALKNSSLRRPGLGGIAIGGLLMTVILITMQVTFGVSVLREMSLPSFEMSRLIYFGRFIQRVEAAFIPVWALIGMLKVSIGSYITGLIITRMLKLPYYRPFILPVALLIFSVAFIPTNVSETVWLDLNVVRIWGWIPVYFLPIVLLVVAVITKKPGKKRDGGLR